MGHLRKTPGMHGTLEVGLAAKLGGCAGGADLGDSEVMVGYGWGCCTRRSSQSHTRVQESIEKCSRDEQVCGERYREEEAWLVGIR